MIVHAADASRNSATPGISHIWDRADPHADFKLALNPAFDVPQLGRWRKSLYPMGHELRHTFKLQQVVQVPLDVVFKLGQGSDSLCAGVVQVRSTTLL